MREGRDGFGIAYRNPEKASTPKSTPIFATIQKSPCGRFGKVVSFLAFRPYTTSSLRLARMSHPVESVAQLPVLNNSERKPSLDNEKSYNEEEKKSVSDVFVNVEQVGDGIYDIKVRSLDSSTFDETRRDSDLN